MIARNAHKHRNQQSRNNELLIVTNEKEGGQCTHLHHSSSPGSSTNKQHSQRRIQRRFGIMCPPPPPSMEYSSISSSSQQSQLQGESPPSPSPSSANITHSFHKSNNTKRTSERRMNRRNASLRHELRDLSSSVKSMTLHDRFQRNSNYRQSVQSLPYSMSSISQDSSSQSYHKDSQEQRSFSYHHEDAYAYEDHYEENYVNNEGDNDADEEDEVINCPSTPLVFVEPMDIDVICHEHGSLKINHEGNDILRQVIFSYIHQDEFQHSGANRRSNVYNNDFSSLNLSSLEMSVTMNVILDLMKDRGGRFLYQRTLSSPPTMTISSDTSVPSGKQLTEPSITKAIAQYYEMDDYSAVEEIGQILRDLI